MSTSNKALSFRILSWIENAGNRLPHPTLLFVWLSLLVLVASFALSYAGISAVHPLTDETIRVINLLDLNGIYRIFSNAVTNFTHFAPVGVVLVIMLGMGVAEHSGLIASLLSTFVKRIPESLVAYAVAFLGVMSSLGADVGYVVLIPLAALIYRAYQRPPLAGIAVAFAGVSAGFSANLIVGPVDVMLAGISSEAAAIVDSSMTISATANYYFIAISTVLITFICGWVSNHIVEPRLRQRSISDQAANPNSELNFHPQTSQQDSQHLATKGKNKNRALFWSGVFTAGFFALIAIYLVLTHNTAQNNPQLLSFAPRDLLKGLVPLLACYFAGAGYIYGRLSGAFQSAADAVTSMEKSIATMAYYIVLMFFAAQFVNWFAWSNIGILLAVKGAALLTALQFNNILLLLGIIIVSASINLFVGSASAKWALLAPVFVPMLMLVDIHPALTQLAYRIGDSTTNIITPLMPYFGIVLAYMQRYKSDAGMGHIISMMIPYSLSLLLGWSALLALWLGFQLPVGF